MQTEYEGIRTELSDFEQILQPSKQSDEGHHLEAGIGITGPTSEVSVFLSELNLSAVSASVCPVGPHRCVYR